MSKRSIKKRRQYDEMNQRADESGLQFNYRSAPVSFRADGPSTIDDKTRSVEIILGTEEPAVVYDYDRGRVREVLLMSGAQMPANNQLVLLNAHSRYDVSDIIGSARNLKMENGKMIGRAYYSEAPEAESPWIKTKEGHLTDYSLGYLVDEVVWVEEGKTAIIEGRTFAGPLQVATKWTPREVSAVPIGADQNAKARAGNQNKTINKEDKDMDPKVRAMLESKGLPADATEEQALAFLAKLEVKTETTPLQGDVEKEKENDKEASIRAAATGELLTRIRDIDALCSKYDCADMARSFIIENKTLEEAQRAVMDKIHERAKNQNPGTSGVEITAEAKDKFRAAAEHGLVLRAGMKVENPAPGADELRGYTLVEMARECLRASGRDYRGSVKEMVGRALTASDFPNILANLATKSMQDGWDSASETWPIWTGEGSVSDFKTYYDNALSEFDDLEEIPDSGEIKFGSFSEKAPETYKIASYGKKFKVTRVMIINDDLNALTSLPARRTEAANRKIGDIVYAILTGNGTMGDGYSIFDSTNHANDAASGYRAAPGIATIAEAVKAMKSHKDIKGLRRLNIQPKFFIAPVALEGVSEVFFKSEKFADEETVATDSSLAATRVNPYSGSVFTRVYEPRLDDDDADGWYIAGPKGKTVKVVFLNGQKGPILEMIQPGFSVEGFEYAVVIDAGAYAQDYRGLYRNIGG